MVVVFAAVVFIFIIVVVINFISLSGKIVIYNISNSSTSTYPKSRSCLKCISQFQQCPPPPSLPRLTPGQQHFFLMKLANFPGWGHMSWANRPPRDRKKLIKNMKIAQAKFSLENRDILKEIHYFLR